MTTAIVAGGVLTAVALGQGHLAAIACGAGVFAGSEIAALGRRFDAGRTPQPHQRSRSPPRRSPSARSPAPRSGSWHKFAASPAVGNAALVAAVVLGVVLLAARRWRDD